MSKEEVFNSNGAVIWFYPEEKVIHHQWKGSINGSILQETLNTSAELFELHQCKKYLSDDRLNDTIPEDQIHWAMSEWNPRVLAAGWKYWAIVMPDLNSAKVRMQHLIKFYQKVGLTTQLFKDPNKALAWLMEQE